MIHVSTRSIAASEPAATPAAVNPAPAKTTGVATTAAAPAPTAARVLPETMGSEKSSKIFFVCFMHTLRLLQNDCKLPASFTVTYLFTVSGNVFFSSRLA